MIAEIKKNIFNILQKEESQVVKINGDWGTGKTYFWNEISKQISSKTAYISLFGVESISDIKSSIFIQVAPKEQKIKHKLNKIAQTANINLPGINIPVSQLLPLLNYQYFSNITVCFDDLERLSDKISIKDILGIISELKEQKKCKVIIILNEDKLNDKGVFQLYKEKIIDYSFTYNPTSNELYEIVKDNLQCFNKESLKALIKEKNINNIRLIKKIINALNDFQFIEPQDQPEDIQNEIIDAIFTTILIAEYGIEFTILKEHAIKKDFSTNNEFKISDKDYEINKILELINTDYYFIKSNFFDNLLVLKIFEYHKTSSVDKVFFTNYLKDKINNHDLDCISNNIRNLYERYLYDMQYNKEDFVVELFDTLQTNKDKLLIKNYSSLNYSSLIFYIKNLEKLDVINKDKYHEFAVNTIEEFINENGEYSLEVDDFMGSTELFGFDKRIKKYLEKYKKNKYSDKINSKGKILNLMLYPLTNNGWNDEGKLLARVDSNKLKQYIIEDWEFCKTSNKFLIKYLNNNSFEDYILKLKNIFEELSESNNSTYSNKSTNIINNLRK
jgi:hypothetical protein